MRRRTRSVPVRVAVAGLAAAALLVPAAAAAAARVPAAGGPMKQPVATGTGGAVSSVDLDASKAGIEVLRAGGNAVDAAVAMASTLGVTEPFVAGPGGGGYFVVYLARQHRVVTLDGREACPAACTSTMFTDPGSGKPLPFEQARRSGISVGVPGMVATWAKAVGEWGSRSFAADLGPAIRTAYRGFTVDEAFRDQEIASLADLQTFAASRKLFLDPSGNPLAVGSTLRNPDLGRTYQDLAANGPDYLYRGALGRDIVDIVRHPDVVPGVAPFRIRNGFMTPSDLAAYEIRTQAPTHVNYRGLDVYSMGPSSSGGLTVGEALNILSAFPLGTEDRATALFHYLEASRLAFADRNAYDGDPRYVNVPTQGLLDPAYAVTRSCLIKDHALTSPVAPGSPFAPYGGCGSGAAAAAPGQEGTNTNHLVAVDKWGNVVSYTNTIEQLAGSGITVPGRGFLLNNEMTDFNFAPATPTTYTPNLPAPGKRPRSSMSPTIVLRNGAFDFAVGSPGGSTIITTVLQILVNHIDFGLSLPAAIAAPRASQQNSPTTLAEPAFLATGAAQTLENRYGEVLKAATGAVPAVNDVIGNAAGVQSLGSGRYQAAAEPTRLGGGSALVVTPDP